MQREKNFKELLLTKSDKRKQTLSKKRILGNKTYDSRKKSSKDRMEDKLVKISQKMEHKDMRANEKNNPRDLQNRNTRKKKDNMVGKNHKEKSR